MVNLFFESGTELDTSEDAVTVGWNDVVFPWYCVERIENES